MFTSIGTNERLRTILQLGSLTHDAVARAVNKVAAEDGALLRANRSTVTHWINGTKPRPYTILYLCEALTRLLGQRVRPTEIGYGDVGNDEDATPVDPVKAITRLGRADVDRRGLLSGAVYSLAALAMPGQDLDDHAERATAAAAGKAIGWAEVESATSILRAFDAADERLGGGHGRTSLVEYLATDVAAYLMAPASADVRGAMFSVATELAYLAGWKCHDLMLEGLAQRYYLHAWELAKFASDASLAGYVLRIMAHQAFDLGHAQHCVDLADRSTELVRGRVDPHTLGVFELTRARAHGVLGEPQRAAAALGRAEQADAAAREGDARPGWVKMRNNRGQFHSHFAKTLLDIGDYAEAERHFHLAHHQRDRETHALIAGLSQAWLAEAQFKRGKLGDALTNWAGAKARYQGVQSKRADQTMMDMRAMLRPLQKRRIPEVDALLAA